MVKRARENELTLRPKIAVCFARAVREVLSSGPTGKRGRPRLLWHIDLVPLVDELRKSGYGFNEALDEIAEQAHDVWEIITWHSRRCQHPESLLRRAKWDVASQKRQKKETADAASVALQRISEGHLAFRDAALELGLSIDELREQGLRTPALVGAPAGSFLLFAILDAVTEVESHAAQQRLMEMFCGEAGKGLIELIWEAQVPGVLAARREVLQRGSHRFPTFQVLSSGLPEDMCDPDNGMLILSPDQLRKLWGGNLSPILALDGDDREERIKSLRERLRQAYQRGLRKARPAARRT